MYSCMHIASSWGSCCCTISSEIAAMMTGGVKEELTGGSCCVTLSLPLSQARASARARVAALPRSRSRV